MAKVKGPGEPMSPIQDDPWLKPRVIADRIKRTAVRWTKLRARFEDRPAPGSLGEREIEGQEALADRWGEDPAAQAHDHGRALLAFACEGAVDFAGLIQGSRRSLLALAATARAVLEVAARASWALDSTIKMETRVARVMNERLLGSYEQARILPAQSAELSVSLERIERILGAAEAKDFSTKEKWVAGVHERVIDTDLPSMREIVGELERPGENWTDFGYWFYSVIVHGTALSYMMMIDETVRRDESGRSWVTIEPTPLIGEFAAYSVLRGLLRAGERAVEVFGWDLPQWKQWEKELAVGLRG